MVHDVFVSYSTKDKAITDSIVAALEQNQIRCWYAPRDIRPSEDWGNAISNAIEECNIFLIIFSGNSNHSRRVLDELNLAIAQEITILPFRIEKLEPDGAMRLHLSSRHWLDAYDPSWQSHLKKLITTISSYLETSIPEEDVQVPETIVQEKKKKKRLSNKAIGRILSGIAALIVVMFLGWVGLTSMDGSDDGTQALASPTTEQIAAPTEVYLSGNFNVEAITLDNLQFAADVSASDQPLGIARAFPSGSNQICLFWEYAGMQNGMGWGIAWYSDGEHQEASSFPNQIWSGGSSGAWWACISSDAGLEDGLYEVVLEVEGDQIASEAVYVGGEREIVSLTVANNSVEAICYLQLSPSEAQNWGPNELGTQEVIEPGKAQGFEIASGEYDIRMLNCDSDVLAEQFGIDVEHNTTYTLSQ
jgi:hypothetical protein